MPPRLRAEGALPPPRRRVAAAKGVGWDVTGLHFVSFPRLDLAGCAPARRASAGRANLLEPRHLVCDVRRRRNRRAAAHCVDARCRSSTRVDSVRSAAVAAVARAWVASWSSGCALRAGTRTPRAWWIAQDGILNVALRDLAKELGDATVLMADTCLDEFTDHGHCGVHGCEGPGR